jgi:hypothetical protein
MHAPWAIKLAKLQTSGVELANAKISGFET